MKAIERRGSGRRRFRAAAMALMILAAGCAVDADPLDGVQFACSESLPCADGFVCEAGRCARGEATADSDAHAAPADGADAGTTTDAGGDPCALGDAEFCASHGRSCGALTAEDACGRPRTVDDCGSCQAPKVCGPAGVCG